MISIIKRTLFILLLTSLAVLTLPVDEITAQEDELIEILDDIEDKTAEYDGMIGITNSHAESLGIDLSGEIEGPLDKDTVENLLSSLKKVKNVCQEISGLYNDLEAGIEDYIDELENSGSELADEYYDGAFSGGIDDYRSLARKYASWITKLESVETGEIAQEPQTPQIPEINTEIPLLEIDDELKNLKKVVTEDLSEVEIAFYHESRGFWGLWGLTGWLADRKDGIIDGNKETLIDNLEARRRIYMGEEGDRESVKVKLDKIFSSKKAVNEGISKGGNLSGDKDFTREMGDVEKTVKELDRMLVKVAEHNGEILRLLKQRIERVPQDRKHALDLFHTDEFLNNETVTEGRKMLKKALESLKKISDSLKDKQSFGGPISSLIPPELPGAINPEAPGKAEKMPPVADPGNVKKIYFGEEGNFVDDLGSLSVIGEVANEFFTCNGCTSIHIRVFKTENVKTAMAGEAVDELKISLIRQNVSQDDIKIDTKVYMSQEENSFLALTVE